MAEETARTNRQLAEQVARVNTPREFERDDVVYYLSESGERTLAQVTPVPAPASAPAPAPAPNPNPNPNPNPTQPQP